MTNEKRINEQQYEMANANKHTRTELLLRKIQFAISSARNSIIA